MITHARGLTGSPPGRYATSMTNTADAPAPADRKRAALVARLDRATTSYRLARAARQDKGQRIESAREAKARQRRDAAAEALRAYDAA